LKKESIFRKITASSYTIKIPYVGQDNGAILFGSVNAIVPIVIALLLTDLSIISWLTVLPAIILIAIVSTFLGLFIAVSVSKVFEAQTFSNFFCFPMIFLYGLFFTIDSLPLIFRPLSYILTLTYGVDILYGAITGTNTMSIELDFFIILLFCVFLFYMS
jgi:ABC-2 type transport system permease protein